MVNKPESAISAPPSSDQDEVYVMPQKFNPQKAKLAVGKGLIIGLAILLIIAVGAAGYFLYDMWQKNKPEKTTDQPSAASSQSSSRTLNQAPEIEPVPTSTLPLTFPTSTDLDITTTTEPDLSIDQPAIILELATDTDRDGLTDIEESIIGTSATRPDSDSDGFTDAKELANGYSPVAPGEAKLVDDDFVSFFYTDFSNDNFIILGIKDWTVNSISTLKQLRITINTGETIKISVLDNIDDISALNWYLQENPDAALSDIETIELADDFVGLISADGSKAYLTNQRRDKIYAFEYLVDGQDNIFRYPNLFRMIVNSFKLGLRPMPETDITNASSTPSDNNSTST